MAFIWQPVASTTSRGGSWRPMADASRQDGEVNVAARNDAYGTNPSAVFKDAWTAGAQSIPKFVIYNHQQPTLDSEAQEVIQGNPDAWLFIDFSHVPSSRCRSPAPGSGIRRRPSIDTLVDCQSRE